MSVTFWMPQAPVCKVFPYEDEPDYYEVQPAPGFYSVNLSNCNAVDILTALSVTIDSEGLFGQWGMKDIDRLYFRTMKLLNTKAHGRLVIDTIRDGNFIDIGRDLDYVTRRLGNFLELFRCAREHQFPIVFG